jgi:MFS family permease
MKYYVKIAMQHLAMGLIIPIVIIWKMQDGLSISEAILTESLTLLVTALADVPAGFIASIINNRRSLVLGALLHLVGILLLAIGGSLFIFIFAAIIMGIAWAFVSGADEAYLHDDFIKDQRKYRKYFSKVTIVDEVATILGMLLSSLLVYIGYDLRASFIVAGVILIFHLAHTAFILPASRKPSSQPKNTSHTFSINILKSKGFLLLFPIIIAFAITYEAGRPLWQPHMQAIGIDIAAFGLLFALLKLASIGGSLLSNIREFHRKDLVVMFAIMLIALLLFGISIPFLSIIALCAYLFTENYFRVYMSTFLNKNIKYRRAAVLSIASVIRNGVGAIMIAGAGILSEMSIMIALTGLVIMKIPAMIYIIKNIEVNDKPIKDN